MDNIRTCISFQASTAAKVIARLSRSRLAPFGVTPIQFAVLQAVFEVENQTAAEIGGYLMIDSATIVGVIDRLAAMDLVSRVPDPSDRRIKRLVLNPEGQAALPAMQKAMNEMNDEVDKILSQSAQTVRESLDKLAELQIDVKD